MNYLLKIAKERKYNIEKRIKEIEEIIEISGKIISEVAERREQLSWFFGDLDKLIVHGEGFLKGASTKLESLRKERQRTDSFISYSKCLLNSGSDDEPASAALPQQRSVVQERANGPTAAATRDFFAGKWQMVRIIENVRAGVIGEFWGQARFTPNDDGLICREDGVLRFAGEDTHSGSTTLWHFSEGGRISVRYEDGRPFHDFLTANPIASSIDGDVESSISYEFGEDTWLSTWQLLVPNEEYVMTTRYRR